MLLQIKLRCSIRESHFDTFAKKWESLEPFICTYFMHSRGVTPLAIMYTLQFAISNQKINSDFVHANNVESIYKLTVIL